MLKFKKEAIKDINIQNDHQLLDLILNIFSLTREKLISRKLTSTNEKIFNELNTNNRFFSKYLEIQFLNKIDKSYSSQVIR